jgi:SAM-dependent methyltransferase
MREPLFDLSAQYERMLNQGIRLSGEDRHFFLIGRVRYLMGILPKDVQPKRILDFGCGIGDTTAYLASMFPAAEVIGVDEADRALEHAVERFGADRVRFEGIENISPGYFDLVYVNGVFHHIPPAKRIGALNLIHQSLSPGGKLALFENNPWNPGARMVMKRIPFDRDAIMISPSEAVRLVSESGFHRPALVRSLFYFPRSLAWLRATEAVLDRLLLGAQYCVLAER